METKIRILLADANADFRSSMTDLVSREGDMEVVADYAQRVIVLSAGRVVDDGPTFEVLRRQETLEAADLVAPQVVALSEGLVARRPELAGTAVDRANTLDEMEAAVLAAVGAGARAEGSAE